VGEEEVQLLKNSSVSKNRNHNYFIKYHVFGIEEGGVQLGPLGTGATNRPIMPALGDYDDGEIGGIFDRGNRSTRRNLPPCCFVHHKPHMLPGHKPRPPWWEASN
jgi:hypothetical protein